MTGSSQASKAGKENDKRRNTQYQLANSHSFKSNKQNIRNLDGHDTSTYDITSMNKGEKLRPMSDSCETNTSNKQEVPKVHSV